MSPSWILVIGLFSASTALAQGIRGVTRRMPTVVPGQTASQFFTAGGIPLNPVNPALATIPGAPQASGGAGNRGYASAPVQNPMARPAGALTATMMQRPGAPLPPNGPVPANTTGNPARR